MFMFIVFVSWSLNKTTANFYKTMIIQRNRTWIVYRQCCPRTSNLITFSNNNRGPYCLLMSHLRLIKHMRRRNGSMPVFVGTQIADYALLLSSVFGKRSCTHLVFKWNCVKYIITPLLQPFPSKTIINRSYRYIIEHQT